MIWDRYVRCAPRRTTSIITPHARCTPCPPPSQVVAIPTNRPPRRIDLPLRVYFDPQVRVRKATLAELGGRLRQSTVLWQA